MFEEALVCMTCGRPVDGQVYCSDECESYDSTSLSASASASSSAAPSPYLPPSASTTNLADVPALLPSSLGYPSKGHRHAHQSVSSSSASSVAWSATSDDEDDRHLRIAIEGTDLSLHTTENVNMNDAGSYRSTTSGLTHLLKSSAALSYARRPSSTNHKSTIPILHRRMSSTSNSLASASYRSSFADYSADEESSDVPSGSVSSSFASSVRSRKDTMRPPSVVDSLDQDQSAALKRKRDRTSLPAYFSLLQISHGPSSSSNQSSRSPRSPASLQTLNAISRSLLSSPATPRVSEPAVGVVLAAESVTAETERGRNRRRDPEGRSASTRRSLQRSPPRHLAPPSNLQPACPHHYAEARARLSSMEKVADWVASSPAVRFPTARRNSSPPPKPKWEYMQDGGGVPFGAAVDSDEEEDVLAPVPAQVVEARGRRRTGELDHPPVAVASGEKLAGPGYGSGRSGLKARDSSRRERRGRW